MNRPDPGPLALYRKPAVVVAGVAWAIPALSPVSGQAPANAVAPRSMTEVAPA